MGPRRRRLPLALALAVSGACHGAPVPPPRVWTGPHGQPATTAQDELTCGFLLLPEHIRLRSRPAGWFQRSGVWETTDQAALATWDQELFRLSPSKVYYFRGPKLLFKSEPADSVNGVEADATFFEDCVGIPMYHIRAREGERYGYDIFDRDGILAARSAYDRSDFFPGQLLFTDPSGEPIAVAQSPMVIRPSTDGFSALPDAGAAADGALATWEVWFYGAASTNSSLIHAQRRWVVASVVQQSALRDAFGQGIEPPAWVRAGVAAMFALVLISLALSYCAVCRYLHYMVLPPPPPEQANRFLKHYGAVQPRVQRRAAVP